MLIAELLLCNHSEADQNCNTLIDTQWAFKKKQ